MTHRAQPRHCLPRRRDPFSVVLIASITLGIIACGLLWGFGVI